MVIQNNMWFRNFVFVFLCVCMYVFSSLFVCSWIDCYSLLLVQVGCVLCMLQWVAKLTKWDSVRILEVVYRICLIVVYLKRVLLAAVAKLFNAFCIETYCKTNFTICMGVWMTSFCHGYIKKLISIRRDRVLCGVFTPKIESFNNFYKQYDNQ